MSFNEFLNKVEKIGSIVEANAILRDDSANLRREYFIKSVDEFKSDQAELERKERLLKIGILGRVKAGKSSFLNALIFGGENILPKAATPMTAALTILEYAKSPNFSVEFYTQKDLDEIATKAREYQSKFNECVNAKFIELKAEEQRRVLDPAQIDEAKLRQNALDIVESSNFKIEQEALFACYEQNELIKKSKISAELEAHKDFSGDLEAIRAKLSDFVGESGKFMPFTKSITLRLNNEFLQDVQIIDTPGLNDPVPSRSARTLEFLDKCDAALVLSPAGQFLNASDVDLLDKLDKNSTTKIFFVASRADSQLHGHILGKSNGNLDTAISLIENELSSSISQKLHEGEAESAMIQRAMNAKIILSSSICANFALRAESDLDEDESHALNLLKKHYPNDFSPKKKMDSFKKLANMQTLESIFAELKQQKEAILAQRLAESLATKQNNLNAYQQALIDIVKNQMDLLQSSDLNKLKEQEIELRQVKRNAEFALDEAYENLRDELVKEIRKLLKDKKDEFFESLEDKSESAEDSKNETYTKDKGSGFLRWRDLTGNRYKESTRRVITFKAGAVRSAIKETCANLEELLSVESRDFIKGRRKEAHKCISEKLLKEMEGNSIYMDRILISNSIKSAFNAIEYPEISYESKIPYFISGASGTLSGSEAEQFISKVENYITDFKLQVGKDINSFADKIGANLKGIKLGDKIFSKVISEIERLKDDLADKEKKLEEYKNLQANLEEAMK